MPDKKATGKLKKNGSAGRILQILKKALLIFLAFTVVWVLAYRFINPPVTWLMLQRAIERKADGKEWKIRKQWLNYNELPRNLKIAAMAGEDAGFLKHWGFDANSIEMAYKKNKKGGNIRGGSTISQQTAKNVFLWPGRSWIRKGFEAYFTVLIELLWSKERILEVYLNVIETGYGIYGAQAASQVFYNKPALKLTRGEAALLIAILPNPLRWSPKNPTSYIYRRQSLILTNMRRLRNVKI